MARAPEKLAQAGVAEAAPAASSSDVARLSEEVAALASLDLDELRGRWRKVFRAPAPAHLPRYLVLRINRLPHPGERAGRPH